MAAPRTGLRPLITWFAIGTAVAAFLLWTQAASLGGVAGLLQVGIDNPIRPVIEQQLGEVPLAPGIGHDGQLVYAIGLDLDGSDVAGRLDHAGYRYRRILLPALASLLGLVEGHALLWSLMTVTALSVGLATVAAREIGALVGSGRMAVVGVLANPGIWLGARLLTPDPLGIALGLSAIACAIHRRFVWAAVLAGFAGLAKDQYVLVGIGLAIAAVFSRAFGRAALYAVASVTPLAAWSLVATALVGGGLSPRSNLSLPFKGIVDAVPTWTQAAAGDVAYTTLTLAFLVAAGYLMYRSRSPFVISILGPWLLLAAVASSWVWDFGNNSLRVFAIVGAIVAALGGADPDESLG